jgi:hypothetical protein
MAAGHQDVVSTFKTCDECQVRCPLWIRNNKIDSYMMRCNCDETQAILLDTAWIDDGKDTLSPGLRSFSVREKTRACLRGEIADCLLCLPTVHPELVLQQITIKTSEDGAEGSVHGFCVRIHPPLCSVSRSKLPSLHL